MNNNKKLSEVKAIFSDIDGTLVNTKATLTEETIKAVKNLPIPFYLASGRYYKMMLPIAEKLNLKTPLVSANGGLIINQKGSIIKEFPIDEEILKEILEQLFNEYKDKIGLHIYDSKNWYCNSTTNQFFEIEYRVVKTYPDYTNLDLRFASSLKISKFLLFSTKEICDYLYLDWKNKYGNKLNLFHEKPQMIEIFSNNAFKGVGVKEICKEFNYDLNDIMCAGDTKLDESMLEVAGYKVAMENASASLKEKANIIASHTDDNGLAKLLNQITSEITNR